MESLFSFPVGLFHPLQHAGLSRRTPNCRPSNQDPRGFAQDCLLCRFLFVFAMTKLHR
jgi:hypothetical protein